MGFLLDQILGWISDKILDTFNAVIAFIGHGLLISPDVTGLPQIQALTGRSTWIVDAVFVLFFVAAGVLTMMAGGDERARYTAKDLAPRLVVGFIAAHFSTLLCAQAITVANAVTAAFLDGGPDDASAVTAIRTHVTHASHDGPSALLVAILLAIITVLVVATSFALVVRFGVLIILTAVAPIALACHALPQTDGAARLWWRSYIGCLAIPVLQALTLAAGQWMLLDLSTMLPMLGVPGDPAGIINLLVVIVLLWTTLRIPTLVRTQFVAAQGGRGGSQIMRVLVMQQGMRLLGVRR